MKRWKYLSKGFKANLEQKWKTFHEIHVSSLKEGKERRVLSEITFIPWIINTFENETQLQILDQSFQKRSVRKAKQGDWKFC